MDQELLAQLADTNMEAGYLKAGILGFPKSGKTYTGVLLAIAIIRHFKIPGPVAMLDTESGSAYVAGMVKELTGKDLLAKRTRGFDQMLAWGHLCVKAGVGVAIVDSITHPWRELCDSYLEQKNKKLAGWNKPPQYQLEFQDWGVVKPRWAQWTDFYLNCAMHIIICGRAGWEYEMAEKHDQPGKKELIKAGIKMKTESEFGFEPSLLIEMDRDQDLKTQRLIHRGIVLGDRFGVIDGKSCEFPATENREQALGKVYQFFKPHFELLKPGSHATINTSDKSDLGISEQGDDGWAHEKRQRAIFCEEIQGELVRQWPGQTADEKKAKTDTLFAIFSTRSWTKIENTKSSVLKDGLDKLRAMLHQEEEAPQESNSPLSEAGIKSLYEAAKGVGLLPVLGSLLSTKFNVKTLGDLHTSQQSEALGWINTLAANQHFMLAAEVIAKNRTDDLADYLKDNAGHLGEIGVAILKHHVPSA
jgi:hypothetical protein